MNKKTFLLISGIFVLISIVVVAVSLIVNTNNKDVDDVVGKSLSLYEGLEYCKTEEGLELKDDFSKAYASATTIKILSIDEATSTASIEISSPPLKTIMDKNLPNKYTDNFDVLLEEYMSDIITSIENASPETKITTTVKCGLVEEKGVKLLVNADFIAAVYPDINVLLQEVLIDMMG